MLDGDFSEIIICFFDGDGGSVGRKNIGDRFAPFDNNNIGGVFEVLF